MPLEIIRNDITRVEADAIVNTANPNVTVGAGVDAAIYEAAGKERLLEERKKIGVMSMGDIAVTPAFDLKSDYIIHVIGPTWIDGHHNEKEIVGHCYKKALEKADDLHCESIAFPLLATGTYGFPKDLALQIAIQEISSFLFQHEMLVYLVVYDKESFEISSKAFKEISSYIEEKDVHIQNHVYERRRYFPKLEALNDVVFGEGEDEVLYSTSIDEAIKQKEDTFQQYLFRLIDRKGLEDPEVYKKANMDRKHFSKIRSNEDYHPTKRTAVALAIALELNLDQTQDLLGKAGYTLSTSHVFDIILMYCIEHEIYDINEVNCYLFEYDQATLGA